MDLYCCLIMYQELSISKMIVYLFIKLLILFKKRGGRSHSFIRYIKEKADRMITLAQVLQELSSIKGNLSETIVCADTRFCEIIRLNGFHVINPEESERITRC